MASKKKLRKKIRRLEREIAQLKAIPLGPVVYVMPEHDPALEGQAFHKISDAVGVTTDGA